MVWQWCMRMAAVLVVAAAAWAEPFTYELSTLNAAGTGYDLWEGGFTFEGDAGDPVPALQDLLSVSITSPYSGVTYAFLSPSTSQHVTNLERLDRSPGRLGDSLLTGATASDPRHFWVLWDRPDLDPSNMRVFGLVAWTGGMQIFEGTASTSITQRVTAHDVSGDVVNPAWKLELVGGGGNAGPQPVPEPGTLALLAAALGLWSLRRIVRGRP